MKKRIFLVSISLLLLSGGLVFLLSCYHRDPLTAEDMILAVDPATLLKSSEKDVLEYYEKNKADLKALADYLPANAALFNDFPPVVINKEYNAMAGTNADETMKNIADRLLSEGMIQAVVSLNANVSAPDVCFTIRNEPGVYEQGIRYVGDSEIFAGDTGKYNYVKTFQSLGDGWYYYLYYYNDVRDADLYRQIVWNAMGEKSQKSVLGEDWRCGVVTVEDRNGPGVNLTNHFKGEFVVCVCFYTEQDAFLGPIVRYLDPVTRNIVGYQLRD